MKNILSMILKLFILISLTGCYGLNDKEIYGELTINPKSGWSSLDFTDPKTNKSFHLVSGKYRLQYNLGVYGWRLPSISVFNSKNELLGQIEIPRESMNKDGSFEMYKGSRGNNNSFNIIGGKIKIITQKNRFAKDDVSCTYTVTVSCIKYDSKNVPYTSTCNEDRAGTQDLVYSKNTFYNTYRILFDGQDLINVAVFRASSPVQVEDELISSTICQ